jgi:hypothetical protein
MLNKYFYLAIVFSLLNFSSLFADSGNLELTGKYSMLFDGKNSYPGAAVDLGLPTGLSSLKYGFLFQFYMLSADEGPRLFDLNTYLRLKHEFVFSPGSLEIYCTIPLGITVGSQKYVTYHGATYHAADGSMIKFSGFNTGVIPGIGFRFNNHWAVFAELGLAYHLVSPESLSIRKNLFARETVRPDNVNILSGIFSTGISYRF